MLSARTYYRIHRAFVPLIRAYRKWRPMPRSPEPSTEEERHSLTLVPSTQLTTRMVEVLTYLRDHSSSEIGNYAEFGVYNGTSMICMYDAMTKLALSQPKLIGFDSFLGLPLDVGDEDGGVWRPGQFTCPIEKTLENLAGRHVPIERVDLIAGWYKDTLEDPKSRIAVGTVSVVMIDSDAYSSANLALSFVGPLLADVSAIMFDDWKLNDLDIKNLGEYRAFSEFLDANPNFDVIAQRGYNRKSKIFILRRKF